MVQKPEIQYVGQFYVYGSEAPQPKKKKEEVLLPKERKVRLHRVYIDLTALLGIAAAAALTVALVMGGIRLNTLWKEHNRMQDYVTSLRLDNAALQHTYRTSYNLEDVEKMAGELGLVPESEVETRYIRVTVPEHKHKWTLWENIQWFFEGLFE